MIDDVAGAPAPRLAGGRAGMQLHERATPARVAMGLRERACGAIRRKARPSSSARTWSYFFAGVSSSLTSAFRGAIFVFITDDAGVVEGFMGTVGKRVRFDFLLCPNLNGTANVSRFTCFPPCPCWRPARRSATVLDEKPGPGESYADGGRNFHLIRTWRGLSVLSRKRSSPRSSAAITKRTISS